ncbi:chemotaxis response regulator protein-glutamate methylesterase [Accumulibacter sp.]|uniref:protein-glutamate methylesterase/protein-glutamine glutaminase n=1 Tax=Accumulibacter sp. TaxID=2053492 RepID=UPI0028C473E9|nr:chemotaxis response regulator protein-glutamate methylesterase [Accumulibacter sp.]
MTTPRAPDKPISERSTQVMIVTDSPAVRRFVVEALSGQPGIEVMAAAVGPLGAIDKMRRQWPDVLVLDIETTGAAGISFLRKLMAERPTAVLICSSPANEGGPASLEAMAAGAVGIISRAATGAKSATEPSSARIVRAVRTASRVNLPAIRHPAGTPATEQRRPKNSADVMLAAGPTTALAGSGQQIVAIGTSTGGTQALETVLTRLPSHCLGLVIVQHMPERFTAMLAQRLNDLCQIEVREARDGDHVLPGLALIAPGGKHMMLKRCGTQYLVDVADGPLVNRHKPSVDVLFRSVAKFAGARALGIIMTGMGDDGARGLKEMRDAGARTIAQDEASCIVFGMPREAIKLGAAEQVIALARIPDAVMAFCRSGSTPAS